MAEALDINALSTMTEDALASEFVYWFRVYRNEGRLPDNERAYFKAIAAEQERRKLADATPLMRNWRELKDTIPGDAILLFRLGDFYEAFYEDAARLACACDIALTKRNMVAMAGIPSHSVYAIYLPRILAKGFKVAIADPEDITPALSAKAKITPAIYWPRRIIETHPRFPLLRE